MRLFKLEIKRIMKTKLTRMLLMLCAALTLLMAYLPTTFPYSTQLNEEGDLVTLHGFEALRYQTAVQADIAGAVTPQKVRQAVEAYQACLREYGVQNAYELPEGVYEARITPYAPLLRGVKEAFADPDTGMAPTVMEILPEQVDDYYAACDAHLAALMEMEQEDHPAAQAAAAALYDSVQKPFEFHPQTSSNALDYQVLLAFLILFFCAVIAAPTFSIDYQTGADDILRCAKLGKAKLGAVKVIAALCVCSGAYALCTAVYIVVSNSLFGWEGTRTSIQMMYSIVSLANLSMGQLQTFTALGSLISLCAVVGLSLFISSRAKNTVTSVSLSLLFCLMPLVFSLIDLGEMSSWIACLLPASSASLQVNLLYELTDFRFLNLGGLAVWLPHAMLAFALIEIPVFSIAAVRAYANRRAG